MPGTKTKAAFIPPMLLLRTEKLPEGPEFVHELKLDGYHSLAIKTGGKVQLRSRNDWATCPMKPFSMARWWHSINGMTGPTSASGVHLLPSTTKCFVELNHGQQFVESDLGQRQFRLEQIAVGIERVELRVHAAAITDVGKTQSVL
jgi:hypothetical protein